MTEQERHTSVPLTWCTEYTSLVTGGVCENSTGTSKRGFLPDGGRVQDGDGAYYGDEPWDRVTLRMPESMIDDLDEAVENTDVANRSELIRQCVEHMEFNA